MLDVDFQPLLAWVPVGKQVTLYLRAEFTQSNGTVSGKDCVAVDATRDAAREGSEDVIGLIIPGPERTSQGQTTRDYVTAGVLAWGVAYGGWGKQRKRSDGTWESLENVGTGYTQHGGYVGPVEGDAAYFRYVTGDLGASCGPIVRIACDAGEYRECNACTAIDLTLQTYERRTPRPLMHCAADVPCPVVENPELERLQKLIKHYPTGFVPNADNLGVALYRTRAACETDPSWNNVKPRP